MTIQLSPEQEQVAGEAIQAGLIRTLDELAEVGLTAIRQKLNAERSASRLLDAAQWSRELDAWSEGHDPSTPLLPDEALERESIYGTRSS